MRIAELKAQFAARFAEAQHELRTVQATVEERDMEVGRANARVAELSNSPKPQCIARPPRGG